MELRELRSLAVLAESGSISETARAVHLTPAAVHKQLQQLEAELGVPVYERMGGKLRLTAAAEIILPYLKDIVGQHDTALAALAEWKGLRRGLVRIGSGPSLAVYALAKVLSQFHREHPQVEVDMQTGSSQYLLHSLADGALDLILVVAPDLAEDRSLKMLLELSFEIVAVTTIADAPKRASLNSLASFPFLLFRRGTRIENLIEPYLVAHDFRPDVCMRFDSAEAMKATLLSGTGIALMPSYAVEEEIRSGQLIRVRIREVPPLMGVRLLARHTRYTPPAVSAFAILAKQVLGDRK
jgi:DNA-binding transcriptional LysR family regulator